MWWARMELVYMVSVILPLHFMFVLCVFEPPEVTLSNVCRRCHSFQIDTCKIFIVISKHNVVHADARAL